MKRFTIDVPASLHRQIKAACASRRLNTSSVLRDLLEREFPDTRQSLHSRLVSGPRRAGRLAIGHPVKSLPETNDPHKWAGLVTMFLIGSVTVLVRRASDAHGGSVSRLVPTGNVYNVPTRGDELGT